MIIASVIVTYRQNQSPQKERERNILATLRDWQRFPQHELILVEQDVAPSVPDQLLPAGVQKMFVYNVGPFNKSWAYNLGARQARAPWLCFTDADVLIRTDTQELLKALSSNLAFVKPNTELIDLDEPNTQALLANPEHSLANLPRGRGHSGEVMPTSAPCCYIKRDAYQHIGAWDERFVGWGGEDDAFSYLVERSRLPSVQLPGDAIHLYHPRSIPNSNPESAALYQGNLAVLKEIQQSNDEVLKRFAEVNWQTRGNPNLYVPDPITL